ncbi:acylphosphatase [Erythrobacter sp. JK5]|uniref:acylphosphatase n=1 Tax=Erythrobacter sp. JK5 TaxID=2829500 RepID=UPI001BAD34B8|nr:acylphosphatase [Erythrobacter sp. JK5]QUL39175.1 acylphosphatase [Erythrobacter sp. JK5]
MPATHCIIHGLVQGVFYRDWTIARARSLGLAGWVRNLPDTTVEAHLEGDRHAIARMIAALHEGPPRARVERIEQTEVDPQDFAIFERR